MRTLWKGAISFGLVNIPIKLYTATEGNELKFNFLHARCKTPIRYEKRCPACDMIVPPEEIVRGYEYEKGKYVVFSEADFEDIAIEGAKTIDILDFVDLKDIDPIYYIKTYYLTPGDGGNKAYTLLLRAMQKTGKIAIAKVMIRSKQHLAAVRVYESCLALETMFFPAEIRSTAQLPELQKEAAVNESELDMAIDLVQSLAEPFEPNRYTDEYREALLQAIEAKVAGKEVISPAQPEPSKVIDLMEALRSSIQLAQKGQLTEKTGDAEEEELAQSEIPHRNTRTLRRGSDETAPRRRRATGA
ncbi:MAG TPA: Ku protein [Desulfobacteria bacterium]|nr:Ku protein [Desulfobacteria bacterium]